MKKHVLQGLLLALGLTMGACRPTPRESQHASTAGQGAAASEPSAPVASGYAELNGLKMYYEVHGQGKPLVLLHGSFMTIPLNWARFIPPLARSRQVIVAEMQGHGRTRDTPRELSYENMADDVSGLLAHLKITSADVLGYSMGGGIAFQMAIRHPKQVRRLVILSGAYAHDGWWPEAEAAFATMNADLFKGTPLEQDYLRFGNDPARFPELVKKIIAIDLKPYDWSSEAKAIAQPLLYVMGDADGVRYEHALDLFRAKGGGKMGDMHGLPQSRLAILPGTTHVGITKREGSIVPMVTDFLDSDLNPKPPTF